MSAELDWNRVKDVVYAALAMPPEERATFLRETCDGDQAFQAEVESLLAAHAQAGSFAERPALGPLENWSAVDASLMTVEPVLQPGNRIGAYQIQAPLGAGGMGEVYRARDTTLGRDVAIKILPAAFATDPARLARFEREARVLASINHPHIGAIYGIEESDGVRALVLELVEGHTLADRLQRGPIPVAETLTIARQIAEALEAAHTSGIIHRDLKPANIVITPTGTVKVLDFGLAKALDTPAASNPTSPTITTPAGMTSVGIILGTAAYMSPEQAAGRAADKRSDIWASGVVLFEMLTGQPAFAGDSVTHVLAAVLKNEPDWTALPAGTPEPVRRLLRRCLEKDRNRRLADIADARYELDEALIASSDGSALLRAPAPAMVGPRWRRALSWAVIGALATAVTMMIGLWMSWRSAAPARVTRTTIASSDTTAVSINLDRDVALSPDGSRVVYANRKHLFVRALDALEPVAIASGDDVRGPFVSPDGQWVGYFDTWLKKVAITGGPPITVAAVSGPRGATWTDDGTIIFATNTQATGLQRVSASGGTPEVLTRPDSAHGEAAHLWPEILPGGRAVLFTITTQTGGLETAQIAVLDLRTRTQRILVRGGSHAQYVTNALATPKRGYLAYVAAGTLRAIPFDPDRLETFGASASVVPRLATKNTGAGDFAVAKDGTLVYVDVPGSLGANEHQLVWVDRAGKEETLSAPPRNYLQPRLSPDGTQVALASIDQENDIWIWDLQRATLARLTLDPGLDWCPLWTPDGRRIVFSSYHGGASGIWWQASDGTGAAEQLTMSRIEESPTAITPDGSAVVFNQGTPSMGSDLMLLALDGTRRVTSLVQTKFDERNGTVSPDGRWLAYESNSSGSYEIYIRPFPNVGDGQWQISAAGGTRPLWSRNARELFYAVPDGALWSVPVQKSGSTWKGGPPVKVLEASYRLGGGGHPGSTYDIAPDGQRFLLIKRPGIGAGATPPAVIVVQHWDEELKRLVPTK